MHGRYGGWTSFDTAIRTQTRREPPAADATFDVTRRRHGRAGEFRFRGAPAARRVWDFGDGTRRVRGKSVTHAYERPGRYRVISTAVDRAGRRDVYVRELRVPALRG